MVDIINNELLQHLHLEALANGWRLSGRLHDDEHEDPVQCHQ